MFTSFTEKKVNLKIGNKETLINLCNKKQFKKIWLHLFSFNAWLANIFSQMQPCFLSNVGSDFPFYPSTYSRILALLTHLLLICILFNLEFIQDFFKASVNNFSTTIIITQNSFSWKPWLLQMPETRKFRLVCLYFLSSSLILIYFFLPSLFFTRC